MRVGLWRSMESGVFVIKPTRHRGLHRQIPRPLLPSATCGLIDLHRKSDEVGSVFTYPSSHEYTHPTHSSSARSPGESPPRISEITSKPPRTTSQKKVFIPRKFRSPDGDPAPDSRTSLSSEEGLSARLQFDLIPQTWFSVTIICTRQLMVPTIRDMQTKRLASTFSSLGPSGLGGS